MGRVCVEVIYRCNIYSTFSYRRCVGGIDRGRDGSSFSGGRSSVANFPDGLF